MCLKCKVLKYKTFAYLGVINLRVVFFLDVLYSKFRTYFEYNCMMNKF